MTVAPQEVDFLGSGCARLLGALGLHSSSQLGLESRGSQENNGVWFQELNC